MSFRNSLAAASKPYVAIQDSRKFESTRVKTKLVLKIGIFKYMNLDNLFILSEPQFPHVKISLLTCVETNRQNIKT